MQSLTLAQIFFKKKKKSTTTTWIDQFKSTKDDQLSNSQERLNTYLKPKDSLIKT